MDVCKPEVLRKHSSLDTPRPALVLAEKNNALTTRRTQTREVSSRYKSPSPSNPSGPRRCPSPSTRTVPPSSQFVQKRAQSAERKRPSTPPSPSRPSTPVRDSTVDRQLSSRRTLSVGRFPEGGLWPSTMRSLSVSFQSDFASVLASKKEKEKEKEKPLVVTSNVPPSDHTLRPSLNVGHKPDESSRKATPERKRSPLKGKNLPDHLENSKPIDSLHTRLIDQHRWPSRIGWKVTSSVSVLSKSMDLAGKTIQSLTMPQIGSGLSSSLRRTTSESISKALPKSTTPLSTGTLSLDGSGRVGIGVNSHADNKLVSTSSLIPIVRSQLSPKPSSRPSSPSRISSYISRGTSPSQTRPSTPPSGTSPARIRPSTPPQRGTASPSRIRPSTPPRGNSPSRIRPSSSIPSNNSTSVLSFIADFKKGKRGENYIEDAHQLRLLYNKYLQWRFVNARAETVLHVQKVAAERTLFNVWSTTLDLSDSVTRTKIALQQLKLELKLNSVLDDQMDYLNEWSELEGEHISSLSVAVEDLEASTLRLPASGGARADIESLKGAICSAVDVMQAMGPSICSSLSRMEGMNSLVSELADMAAWEQAMLNECEALLASTGQVEEYSTRTHLIQMKQGLEKDISVLAFRTPPLTLSSHHA